MVLELKEIFDEPFFDSETGILADLYFEEPLKLPPILEAQLSLDAFSPKVQSLLKKTKKVITTLTAQAQASFNDLLALPTREEIARALVDFLGQYRLQLASLLSITQLAALVEGAVSIAAEVPTVPPPGMGVPTPPALEPAEAAAVLRDLTARSDSDRELLLYLRPPDEQRYLRIAIAAQQVPPEPFALPAPVADSPEEIHFPTVKAGVDLLRKKNLVDRRTYLALDAASRDKAFTLAGQASTEAMARIRDAIADNIETGTDLRAFRKAVKAAGLEDTFLSDSNLEAVFRTTVQAAYSDGQLQVLRNPFIRSGFPYVAYDAIHDDRVREEHLEMEKHGIDGSNVFRVDDPIFQIFRPPWSWNCRCSWTPITVRQAAERGIAEAIKWQASGIEPSPPAFVAMPPFQPPAEFRRAVESAPLSIQLALSLDTSVQLGMVWVNGRPQWHGKTPPSAGWVRIGTGPRGGLIWEPGAEALQAMKGKQVDVPVARQQKQQAKEARAKEREAARAEKARLAAERAAKPKAKTKEEKAQEYAARVEAAFKTAKEIRANPEAATPEQVAEVLSGILLLKLPDVRRLRAELGLPAGKGAGRSKAEVVDRIKQQAFSAAGVKPAAPAIAAAAPAAPTVDLSQPTADNPIIAAMAAAEPDFVNGALIPLADLRKALPDIPRPELDKALLGMIEGGVLGAHRHNFVSQLSSLEKDQLLADGRGNHFMGVMLDSRSDAGQAIKDALEGAATPHAPTAAPPETVTPPAAPEQASIDINDHDSLARAIDEILPSLPATMNREPLSPNAKDWERGTHKVFISEIYDALKSKLGGATLDQFKESLLRANQTGKIKLDRSDLVAPLLDRGLGHLITDSEISSHGATFHAIKPRSRTATPPEAPQTPATPQPPPTPPAAHPAPAVAPAPAGAVPLAPPRGPAAQVPAAHAEYTASDGTKVKVPAYDESKVPADFALPNEAQLLEDVAAAVKETGRRGGQALTASVYDTIKAKHPDLSLADFHKQILAWGNRGLLAPQRFNDPNTLSSDQLAKSPALVSDDPASKRANVVIGTIDMVPGWQNNAPAAAPTAPPKPAPATPPAAPPTPAPRPPRQPKPPAPPPAPPATPKATAATPAAKSVPRAPHEWWSGLSQEERKAALESVIPGGALGPAHERALGRSLNMMQREVAEQVNEAHKQALDRYQHSPAQSGQPARAAPAPATPKASRASPAQHAAALQSAVKTLDTTGDNLVPLSKLREHLASQGLSREQQDATLQRMQAAKQISLTPDDGREKNRPGQAEARYKGADYVSMKGGAAAGAGAAPAAKPAVKPGAGFGQPGHPQGHPLAGKPRKEQADFLGRWQASDAGGDPLGVHTGMPEGLDQKAFEDDLLGALGRHTEEYKVGDTIDQFYGAVGKKYGLSKHDFLRAVTSLADAGKVRTSGWPRGVQDLPDPELVTTRGTAVMAYLQPPTQETEKVKELAGRGDQSLNTPRTQARRGGAAPTQPSAAPKAPAPDVQANIDWISGRLAKAKAQLAEDFPHAKPGVTRSQGYLDRVSAVEKYQAQLDALQKSAGAAPPAAAPPPKAGTTLAPVNPTGHPVIDKALGAATTPVARVRSLVDAAAHFADLEQSGLAPGSKLARQAAQEAIEGLSPAELKEVAAAIHLGKVPAAELPKAIAAKVGEYVGSVMRARMTHMPEETTRQAKADLKKAGYQAPAPATPLPKAAAPAKPAKGKGAKPRTPADFATGFEKRIHSLSSAEADQVNRAAEEASRTLTVKQFQEFAQAHGVTVRGTKAAMLKTFKNYVDSLAVSHGQTGGK